MREDMIRSHLLFSTNPLRRRHCWMTTVREDTNPALFSQKKAEHFLFLCLNDKAPHAAVLMNEVIIGNHMLHGKPAAKCIL